MENLIWVAPTLTLIQVQETEGSFDYIIGHFISGLD